MAREAISTWRPSRLRLGINRSGDFGLVAAESPLHGNTLASAAGASGRYAMLDDGVEASLVPWRPVIEQRLGQQIAATMRGSGVSWELGRQRGPEIG
ncbi:MAG TPA: DUF3363 domain-containing protein [Methylophilaceae bacterium]|jgi:hypothetical protein|uniref:DUF3363 domain-containing protein n=1 Tax=Ideonella sp. TaxID=1929293 RepID=UPI002BC2505F|nr:DUF3363 domain-containing protein [Methylophilaceae bacterium]